MTQNSFFSEEIEVLNRAGSQLSKNSPIFKLNPFTDSEGFLRVGGRQKESNLDYSEKHPLLLPRKGGVTKLFVKYHHELVSHQGRGMTCNSVRSHGLWIVGLSKAVSSHIHYCVVCRKQRGNLSVQKMANLPKSRVEENPPFTVCGTDCFGPYRVIENRKTYKRYGVIFTCFASRAVHLKILENLSSDAFINAFRCFISVRGNVKTLYCDQGKNFVGALNDFQKAINEINSLDTAKILSKYNCDFKFNTPAASHMGGVWERHIRTVRSILTNLLNAHPCRVDSFELRTLFCEVMSILNSRPLSVENLFDVSSPRPITPNHLLTMKTSVITSPPGNFATPDLYVRKKTAQNSVSGKCLLITVA